MGDTLPSAPVYRECVPDADTPAGRVCGVDESPAIHLRRVADTLQSVAANLHSHRAQACCAEALGWIDAAVEHEQIMRAVEPRKECER